MKTADNHDISPEDTEVYFYPDWATDRKPSRGLAIFDNADREWRGYHGKSSGPLFATRAGVDAYISQRHEAEGRTS